MTAKLLSFKSLVQILDQHSEKGYQIPKLIRLHPTDFAAFFLWYKMNYFRSDKKTEWDRTPNRAEMGGLRVESDYRVQEGTVELVNIEKLEVHAT